MAYIDQTKSSPDDYKVILDGDDVRVPEMTVKAGEPDNEHSHPDEVAYFITGGKVRIHDGGEAAEMGIPDGFAMHHPEWTHRVENIGDTDIRAIVFEPK